MDIRNLKRELEQFDSEDETVTRTMFFESKLFKYLERLEERIEDLEKEERK